MTWRPQTSSSLACGETHTRVGALDERARRLSHQELSVAEQLVSEGHQVRSVAERPGLGRAPDVLVCGAPLEIKSWLGVEAGRHRAPTARSVVNKVLQADGQAPVVVLNGRGSGLTAAIATRGMAEYAARPDAGTVRAVRVLGDGFDLAWVADRSRQRHPTAPDRRPARDAPDLGRTR